MPNVINKLVKNELSDAFREAEGMVLASLNGLTVSEPGELRTSLAEHGLRLRMVRNRLANLALADRGLEAPDARAGGSGWG